MKTNIVEPNSLVLQGTQPRPWFDVSQQVINATLGHLLATKLGEAVLFGQGFKKGRIIYI